MRKYKLHDAFPKKKGAINLAKDMRKQGETASVRKINDGRLKYAVYTAGKRL